MKTINDNNRKIHSAAQVVDELGIAPQTLVDLASKLKCIFLIEIPDNTEVHLTWPKPRRLAADFLGPTKCSFPRANDESVIISPEIELLCLTASDCDSILQTGALRKKEFLGVARFNKNAGVIHLSSISYAQQYLMAKEVTPYLLGSFFTRIPQNVTNASNQASPAPEKSIIIRFDDIFISTENFQAILKELNNKPPSFEKLETEDWISTMLAQLNKASTHFISGELSNVEKSKLRDEIRKWFVHKWPKGGDDLLDQAVNVILPDSLYKHSPHRDTVSELVKLKYNRYASTALILINEKAETCWQIKQSSAHKKYPKRNTIKDELKDDWKFSVKLANAAATIIRPDKEK
ncbi:hypothetical protein FQ186_20780 [Pseudomonas sp. ANT_H14]|uniref:hypothetical protein n=1 Tax=unclassified Pseudomonas TaxID=196821 RepID=UPI0011ECF183|nr:MULTISPECIES: hypothetical protein [unclassified Pseudomonas]KAA0943745.1 hypothetical protein FQ182_23705 [Pseudomonas sp. ANT_H4]KAA0950112.1 hypothetical protein FQ186_20780 [Pseudomonas sp. ANT_H14]